MSKIDLAIVFSLSLAGCAFSPGNTGASSSGAGGNGGSLTILSRSGDAKEALERETAAVDGRYRVLPIQVSNVGLRVRGAL